MRLRKWKNQIAINDGIIRSSASLAQALELLMASVTTESAVFDQRFANLEEEIRSLRAELNLRGT